MTEVERWIAHARREWDYYGVISTYTAARLIDLGVLVGALETKWSNNKHEDV